MLESELASETAHFSQQGLVESHSGDGTGSQGLSPQPPVYCGVGV